MGKFIDKSGWVMKEHGVPDSRLTVLFRAPNQGKKVCWHVKCECGKEFDLRGDSLDGNTLSCGCLHKERFKPILTDHSGEIFGLLTAIKPIHKNNKVYWRCRCKCGNITDVITTDLLQGHTKSCGCLQRYNNEDNLSGQHFGKLTVIEYYGSDNGKHALYRCLCDCGTETIVRADSLRGGFTTSCGCITSIGEEHIIKVLQENNIKYIHDEPYFTDLINPDTDRLLRYDFILMQDNKPYRLIEFDGEQHSIGWARDKQNLIHLEYRDTIKDEYARTHNIPLVRIPYKERDHITLEMIMGDKYLIKPSNG